MVRQSASLQQNRRKMALKRREARARIDRYELLLKQSSSTIMFKNLLQKLFKSVIKLNNANLK